MNCKAIVLAAGVADKCRHTSLSEVCGHPAISYVVDNLKNCAEVSEVIVVANEEAFRCVPNADVCVPESGDLGESILAGLHAAQGASHCLLISGDMPLASSDAVSDMLKYAPDADMVYPIVERTDMQEFYPQRNPFYVKTQQGHFTGSSALLVKPETVMAKKEKLIQFLNARKNPQALLSLVGPWVALKFVASTLALTEFEELLSNALHLTCRVFISHFPDLFISIDSPEDVALVESELSC